VGRRNAVLNEATIATARRLTKSEHPAARWIGREGERELTSALVQRIVAKKAKTGNGRVKKL
jgi:hypothetical protein